jgi:hypothetical protein
VFKGIQCGDDKGGMRDQFKELKDENKKHGQRSIEKLAGW